MRKVSFSLLHRFRAASELPPEELKRDLEKIIEQVRLHQAPKSLNWQARIPEIWDV
jgi:hypothetical protein